MTLRIRSIRAIVVILALVAGMAPIETDAGDDGGIPAFQWTEENPAAAWQPRAGLKVLRKGDRLYLLGGRTPRPPSFPPIPGDSDIWGDVWVSDDRGGSWERILETDDQSHWPARAYFQAVSHRGRLVVLGGQNFRLEPNDDCPPGVPGCPPFVSVSDFFSDVWASQDGVAWTELTADAGWEPRAGLSAISFKGFIYVLGGSQNDDSSIVGGPPERIYFNDVWRSRNGRDWEQVTEEAPWAPRAGAVVVVKNGFLYLLGGEEGFTCDPLPTCTPPYFNDVWRTRDGEVWELVTEAADWPARPGHGCGVLRNEIVCFGGFGLLGNPMDVWTSGNGRDWTQVSDSPWNAVSPDEIKYDFAYLVVPGDDESGVEASIFTFGGDRETFDFTDPDNWLRIDNDVWSFGPPIEN